jgi:hypothetical protein
MKKLISGLAILPILIWGAAIIGEIKCIVKMVSCNWHPIDKSEIIYTLGVFTGAGCIIGYINIEDK